MTTKRLFIVTTAVLFGSLFLACTPTEPPDIAPAADEPNGLIQEVIDSCSGDLPEKLDETASAELYYLLRTLDAHPAFKVDREVVDESGVAKITLSACRLGTRLIGADNIGVTWFTMADPFKPRINNLTAFHPQNLPNVNLALLQSDQEAELELLKLAEYARATIMRHGKQYAGSDVFRFKRIECRASLGSTGLQVRGCDLAFWDNDK